MIRKHHQLMWTFSKSIIQSLKRPVFIYLSSLALTFQILTAIAFYFVEKNTNPRIVDLFDGFYYSVTVTTGVGLGDIIPTTIGGKIITILMMYAGTGIFVCFTGVLAASILHIEAHHLSQTDKSDIEP